MGEDKNQNCIGPSPHDFASTSTKTTPWSLWFFERLGCVSRIGLLGWTNFYITDATAPTPARSVGDFRKILSKSVKERMGRWEGCRVTLLYVGICRVSKIKTLNPVYAQKKPKYPNPPAKICIKEPFTIAPTKCQRYGVPQLGTLEVWSSTNHVLLFLCTAVSCN